jgi:hypothetical protein
VALEPGFRSLRRQSGGRGRTARDAEGSPEGRLDRGDSRGTLLVPSARVVAIAAERSRPRAPDDRIRGSVLAGHAGR